MNNLEDGNKEFNFEEWMLLYKKDPDSFEKNRLKLIQAAINEAPEKMHRRLTGIQWRVDCEIKLAKTPMAGCIKVYQMMMDSVYESDGLLDALSSTQRELKRSPLSIVPIDHSSKKNENRD